MLKKFGRNFQWLVVWWGVIQTVFGAPSLFAIIGMAIGGTAMIWGTIITFVHNINPEAKILYIIGTVFFY